MKAAIGTMVGFIFLSLVVLQIIFQYFLGPEGWDLFPIYSGLILLSGLIVFCTKIVLEEIDGLIQKKAEEISKK
ncbi:hypothetical protein QTL97_11390 [Sporosarcina thermotolerans]|uniref:YiaAB two helix domain-containing protein n=1 Tax=Sporosarcina thermotolerans TaxID=633404 RepID=A0AAW9A803_9BACL|nr:hypothetical protein [Sporosarcina thermotolerans]MDW0117542.1 hypothetical protein [Sporosarcina thermotolerans]